MQTAHCQDHGFTEAEIWGKPKLDFQICLILNFIIHLDYILKHQISRHLRTHNNGNKHQCQYESQHAFPRKIQSYALYLCVPGENNQIFLWQMHMGFHFNVPPNSNALSMMQVQSKQKEWLVSDCSFVSSMPRRKQIVPFIGLEFSTTS